MYSGISGRYDHQEHHTRFARIQYVPCDEWEKEKSLKPLWPMYLTGAAVIFFSVVLIFL